jgi:pyrimidine-nucleoside phosphorylase
MPHGSYPREVRMLIRDLIERKRDGGRIDPGDWRTLVNGYASGAVPDYQMAALLMATWLQGMDGDETRALTEAMLTSGASLDLPDLEQPCVDKHSTGGVGDTVSLVLAPLVSSLGLVVPMMCGRGLGHTGGTLDKLASIPGFRTDLTLGAARRQLERTGCVFMAQTAEIAPADRQLYALRDATATVESIPLLAASIMSKKLAEGLDALVLDVKRGSGAFLPELDRALELARTMIAIGQEHGCPTVALVTAMDRPLGRACGIALEVEEAINALRREGPPDLLEVTYALGAEMLVLGGGYPDHAAARRAMEVAISSGRAVRQFARIIEEQGGNPSVVEDPAVLPQARQCELFEAPHAGIVSQVEPRAVGRGVVALGGGRARMDDRIDPSVGFVISAKPGDLVEKGEPLATVFARDGDGVRAGMAALGRAVVISDEGDPPMPLVTHRVSVAGVERYVPEPSVV